MRWRWTWSGTAREASAAGIRGGRPAAGSGWRPRGSWLRRARKRDGSRVHEKATAAVEEIRATAAEAARELVALDRLRRRSVRAAAGQIMAAHESIDLLINNAGVMGIPEAKPMTAPRCSASITWGTGR